MYPDPKFQAVSPFGVVVLPSYNSGTKLLETVTAVLEKWRPVWVVIDGSTDGSDRAISELARSSPDIQLIRRETNGGKGAAVLTALRLARDAGFSHALVMDADGKHPAEAIGQFFNLARENPNALILGQPVFGPDAPALRVHGRRVGNLFSRINTAWGNVGDSLFGFRVYPVAETVAIMEGIRTARRFDFDTEIVVRLCWAGFSPMNLPVPVRYFSASEGGSTYFRYVRDNALLVRTHIRLFFGMLVRFPRIIAKRRKFNAA